MITAFHLWPRTEPEENRLVGEFVSNGVWGNPHEVTDYSTMAVLEDGKLIAGTVYHNWHPESGVIELTSYSTTKKWLTRKVIHAMMHAPFKRLGCQLIALRVSERNVEMCAIARKFGFSEVFIPRLRGRDEGEFIFTLTDDQWQASKYYREVA